MADTQLYLAIGVPIAANALFFSLLMAYINAKIHGVDQRFNAIGYSASTPCATSGARNSTASKKYSTPVSNTSVG